MKLSRALLIVLVLHVVAVAGHHRVQRDQDAPGRSAATADGQERERESGGCIRTRFRGGNSETDRDREPRRRKTKALGRCERGTENRKGEARAEKLG